MPQGTVITYSRDHGYGFIRAESGENIMVYFESIVGEAEPFLRAGDRVHFQAVIGPGLRIATKVKKTETDT